MCSGSNCPGTYDEPGLLHPNVYMCVCLCACVCDDLFSRAQNLFRQAMRTPRILFHVVPSVKKPQYEVLSQNELGLRSGSDPGDRGSVLGGVMEYSPRRMSKAESNQGYPTLPHLARRTPPGPIHPTRPTSAASSVGFSKKIGRKFNVQLRKGTVVRGCFNKV